MLSLIQAALELGLICSLTVLALFLSYSMLGVCDLSTDGCFTLGAVVGAVGGGGGPPPGPQPPPPGGGGGWGVVSPPPPPPFWRASSSIRGFTR